MNLNAELFCHNLSFCKHCEWAGVLKISICVQILHIPVIVFGIKIPMLFTSCDHTTAEYSSCFTRTWVYARSMRSAKNQKWTKNQQWSLKKIIVHIKNSRSAKEELKTFKRFDGMKESGEINILPNKIL